MESRGVVKINNSLYICLPSSMAEDMEIKKGDRCQFLLLPEYGILLSVDRRIELTPDRHLKLTPYKIQSPSKKGRR